MQPPQIKKSGLGYQVPSTRSREPVLRFLPSEAPTPMCVQVLSHPVCRSSLVTCRPRKHARGAASRPTAPLLVVRPHRQLAQCGASQRGCVESAARQGRAQTWLPRFREEAHPGPRGMPSSCSCYNSWRDLMYTPGPRVVFQCRLDALRFACCGLAQVGLSTPLHFPAHCGDSIHYHNPDVNLLLK